MLHSWRVAKQMQSGQLRRREFITLLGGAPGVFNVFG
jgi:hypothetical protein